jgi:hypothetical protein
MPDDFEFNDSFDYSPPQPRPQTDIRSNSDSESSPAKWLADQNQKIKFSILPMGKKESSVSFRLDGRMCLDWEQVRTELLDRLEIPRKRQDIVHLGCTYSNWSGTAERIDEDNWMDIMNEVGRYEQASQSGKTPKAKVGKQPICFRVTNPVSMHLLSNYIYLNRGLPQDKLLPSTEKDSRKRGRGRSSKRDRDGVFDGNKGAISDDDSSSSSDDDGNVSSKRQRRRKSPLAQVDNHENEVERVKAKVQELKKLWACPEGRHPTICLRDELTSRCKPLSLEYIKNWAKKIVSDSQPNNSKL